MIANFAVWQLALLTLVVAAISTGQVLFKYAAEVLSFDQGPAALIRSAFSWQMLLAFSVYGIGALGWVVVLTTVPLSRAYPFMALAFVLVPLLARLLFSEELSLAYWIGTALLVAGLLIIASSSR